MSRPVRAVAFDLDGTLVDSAPDLAASANAMLTALGERPIAEERVAAAVGDGIDVLVLHTLSESAGRAPDDARLANARAVFREQYAQRLFNASTVFPGVREGLQALAQRGYPLGCVTNKHSRFTTALLEKAGLAPFLGFVLCADASEQRKPAPFLLLEACRRLAVAPGELLFVGDSGIDVAAARAAGCPVVLVAYGYNRGVAPQDAGADAVVTGIAELASMLRDTRDPSMANAP